MVLVHRNASWFAGDLVDYCPADIDQFDSFHLRKFISAFPMALYMCASLSSFEEFVTSY